MHIKQAGAIALLTAGLIALVTPGLQAEDRGLRPLQVAYEDKDDLVDILEGQGYTRIVIANENAPYEVAYACQKGDDYRLRLDPLGGIVSRERVGRCGGKNSVAVRAPYSDVDVNDREVSVRAPFTDVYVDKKSGGVHIRAPFVDLQIGR